MFKVTKTYGHERGLSCCFRQWRASHSHCHLLHGYSLSISLVFGAFTLDARQWVIDFGGFDEIKTKLEQTFDHKLVVAQDDPQLDVLCSLAGLECAEVLVLPHVGCEQFAKYVHDMVVEWLGTLHTDQRIFLLECTVAEHGSNSATYTDTALLGSPFLSELMRCEAFPTDLYIDPEKDETIPHP